jgi:hypothetical protein
VSANKNTYIVGGVNDKGEFNSHVYHLDFGCRRCLSTESISDDNPVIRAVHHTASAVANTIVVFGGLTDERNPVNIFDLCMSCSTCLVRTCPSCLPDWLGLLWLVAVGTRWSATKKWTQIFPAADETWPSKRELHTATVVGDVIYVFGGTNGALANNDLYALQPGISSPVACLSRARVPFGWLVIVAAQENQIYGPRLLLKVFHPRHAMAIPLCFGETILWPLVVSFLKSPKRSHVPICTFWISVCLAGIAAVLPGSRSILTPSDWWLPRNQNLELDWSFGLYKQFATC